MDAGPGLAAGCLAQLAQALGVGGATRGVVRNRSRNAPTAATSTTDARTITSSLYRPDGIVTGVLRLKILDEALEHP